MFDMIELGVNVDYDLEKEDQFKPWGSRPRERLVQCTPCVAQCGGQFLLTEIPKTKLLASITMTKTKNTIITTDAIVGCPN